jgi:TetR/AcrR family transcriptional regulator, cholesterol catabolism regulator
MANTRTRASAPPGAAADEVFGSAAQRDRHRRILDATLALASKGGYEAVQMRAVAERADVALGTLYRYFPSKIHLLVSALAREFERYQERLDRRPIPGETPADRVMYVLGRTTRSMERMLTRAMHEGEPSADEVAIARLIGDVWLSHLVAWVTRRASADDVSSHLELAARLLLR